MNQKAHLKLNKFRNHKKPNQHLNDIYKYGNRITKSMAKEKRPFPCQPILQPQTKTFKKKAQEPKFLSSSIQIQLSKVNFTLTNNKKTEKEKEKQYLYPIQ